MQFPYPNNNLPTEDDPGYSESRTEILLRETQRRLRETQRIANLGSWDWDIITDDLWWSQQIYTIFGISMPASPLTYEAFLSFVHPDDRAHVEDAVERAVDVGNEYDIVHRIIRPDGKIRYVREQAEIFRDRRGNAFRMSGTVQDVTEQRVSEIRIRQHEDHLRDLGKKLSVLERASSLGTMLAAIAHELNQPIAALSLYTNRLLKQARAWPGAPDGLVGTLSEVTRLVDVANQVVQRARRAVQPSQVPSQPLDCVDAMKTVLSLMERELQASGITVTITGTNVRHAIMADPIEFELVILKLIRNAIDALDAANAEEPRIDVAVDVDGGGMLSVSIADNGNAVTREVQERMFEPFFTTKQGGWGMGLAICRQFVEEMGGVLTASANEPHGMIFTLTLPICDWSPGNA